MGDSDKTKFHELRFDAIKQYVMQPGYPTQYLIVSKIFSKDSTGSKFCLLFVQLPLKKSDQVILKRLIAA